jgi:hypothetical protein
MFNSYFTRFSSVPDWAASISFNCSASFSLKASSASYTRKKMKRLDQGHLYSKLKVPGLTCPGRESNPGLYGERRVLEKRAISTDC